MNRYFLVRGSTVFELSADQARAVSRAIRAGWILYSVRGNVRTIMAEG